MITDTEKLKTIEVENCLDLLIQSDSNVRVLDVRSEVEFEKGHLPQTYNLPILCTEHRHLVGITYKKKGQDAAIEHGHRLVDPIKDSIIEQWSTLLQDQDPPIAFCWRGGLRSQLSQQWLKSHNVDAVRVAGGYKGLRNRLLSELEALPSLLILSGQTGSRKTSLLNDLHSRQVIDLEGLANHRGSAFGLKLGESQPSQATFENSLLCQFYKKTKEVVLEDESYLIGKRSLPNTLYQKMVAAPRVVVNVDSVTRSQNIVDEYIFEPVLKNPSLKSALHLSFQNSVEKIGTRLGGVLKAQILKELKDAFERPDLEREPHQKWVTSLLEKYYDRAYSHSFSRGVKNVLFSGDYKACEEWIKERLAKDQQ